MLFQDKFIHKVNMCILYTNKPVVFSLVASLLLLRLGVPLSSLQFLQHTVSEHSNISGDGNHIEALLNATTRIGTAGT